MLLLKKMVKKELESRYNDKIKQGYTYLNELCDMQGLPRGGWR